MPPSQNVRVLCLIYWKNRKYKTHTLCAYLILCPILFFLAVRGSPFYYNHPSSSPVNLSKFMPNATTAEHATREPGTLLDSELWWRDHSKVLENHGYRLRPRYRPDCVPSWKKSGKEIYTVEDGQPTLVSIFFHLMPFHP